MSKNFFFCVIFSGFMCSCMSTAMSLSPNSESNNTNNKVSKTIDYSEEMNNSIRKEREAEMAVKKSRILSNLDASLGVAPGKSFLETFMMEFNKKEMGDFQGIGSVIAIVNIERNAKISSVSTEGPNKNFNRLVEKTIYMVNEKYRLKNAKLNERQRVVLPLTIQF